MRNLLSIIENTADVPISDDQFQKIIGQEHAVALVRSAVSQRRHVLLCGVPGIGKSLLAKAAFSLIPPPKEEIQLRPNPHQPDRPEVVVVPIAEDNVTPDQRYEDSVDSYLRPEELPFEIAAQMGYRCAKCGAFSLPSHSVCMDCESAKRSDWGNTGSYQGLLRVLDVIREPALTSVVDHEVIDDVHYHITYRRTNGDAVLLTRERADTISHYGHEANNSDAPYRILISQKTSRFVRASGTSPVELLGDVKHDPYGSAESLGKAAHNRVVPGAIHEAHEGILFIDEIATLGIHQKHLLTAMQDKRYPISGHNPQSSGASVRVDAVPCDFILFASCNIEDLSHIIPPLRSRIRGYGYEIMLNSWMENKPENIDRLVEFIAQTVIEDGKIPHLTVKATQTVIQSAADMALRLDNQRNALTLRLRELGGLIRVAGDLAVQDGSELVQPTHVNRSENICRGIDPNNPQFHRDSIKKTESYGDYFF
ncbi:MAG: ATP-binding protein [Candidatus Thorarchaeota archaeon]